MFPARCCCWCENPPLLSVPLESPSWRQIGLLVSPAGAVAAGLPSYSRRSAVLRSAPSGACSESSRRVGRRTQKGKDFRRKAVDIPRATTGAFPRFGTRESFGQTPNPRQATLGFPCTPQGMAAAVSCALHGLSNGPTTIKPRVSLSARNPFHQASLQTPANLLGTSSESSFIKDSTLSSDSSMPCSEFKLMHRRQLHTSHERACLFDKSGDGPELWAGPSIGEQGRLVVRGGRELAARCLCIPGPGQSGACITDEGGTGNQGSAHRDHDEDEMGEEGAGSPSSRKGTLLGAEETGPREAPGNSGYRDGEGPSPSVSAAISLLKFYKSENSLLVACYAMCGVYECDVRACFRLFISLPSSSGSML